MIAGSQMGKMQFWYKGWETTAHSPTVNLQVRQLNFLTEMQKTFCITLPEGTDFLTSMLQLSWGTLGYLTLKKILVFS